MKTIMTEQGLVIPKEELERLGEIVLEERGEQVVIRPKSPVEATRGIVPSNAEITDRLIESIELGGIWEKVSVDSQGRGSRGRVPVGESVAYRQ
jgi:hypothetical protein